jgi:hypothetical protein
MADERDFELLDDYLTNRMREQDRSAFEQRLQADPDLKNELIIQKRLVKGIQNARVAELKSMLNNVAVPAHGLESPGTKIAIGTVLSILIAAGAYWYFKQDETKALQKEVAVEEQTLDVPVVPKSETQIKSETESVDTHNNEIDKNQTSAGTEDSKPSQSGKPAPVKAPGKKDADKPASAKEPVIDVFDPGVQENEKDAPGPRENQQLFTSKNSSLVVETDTDNRKYSFHYQFKNGKLFLYGPLEKNLYEILEFFTDEKRTVFLYYKNNYYLLEERDFKVRPLTSISDPALLKKLKEYRSTK